MEAYCVKNCVMMFDLSVVCFIMVDIRGSGSGDGYTKRMDLSDEEIRGIIDVDVVVETREEIPELLG